MFWCTFVSTDAYALVWQMQHKKRLQFQLLRGWKRTADATKSALTTHNKTKLTGKHGNQIKGNLIGDHPHTEEVCLERELKWSGKEDAIVAAAARLCFGGGDRANFSVNNAPGF